MNLAAALAAERGSTDAAKTLMRLIEETDGEDCRKSKKKRREARRRGRWEEPEEEEEGIGCAACAWKGIRARRLSPAGILSVGSVPRICGLGGVAVRFVTVRSLRFLIYID
ncbi:hypothetical protein LINPERPRIM_LOCUS3674 [Linum perenne]